LWVATNGGVFLFNLKTGKREHYTTDTGLPHNRINDIFADSKGIVWIATKCNDLVSINSKKRYPIANNGAGELEFKAIAEDKNGNIWAATYGDGVFEFQADTPVNFTEKNGLKSDYCYSMISDNDGNIWVGHRLAVSKINPENHKIITYGSEIGITGDCNPSSANIDLLGNLRFGTTDGLIQYNYLKNRQKLLPPALNMNSIKISDKEIDFTDKIELPYGIYRIRFDFVGLNYRSPSSVKYQYKLEGWESEWSDLSENTYAYYPRVEDGNYTFLIRAYNAEGICASEPYKIEISVSAPIWKRWWFILICVALLAFALFSYIKYRERKQIRFQKYLQKMLDERTREVVEQKEEIENKNRDITDSITYAQRIQASILPSIKKLHDTFSGCFIFYQPRDIVSGDFYWFDKITENKFVIVCGDSTGHGVPGALMSMIGTTLIKDICNRPDVVSPSNILDKLDGEMRDTLNQNIDVEKSSDGMDLIACEIDTDNYTVTIASAMRPVILYQNGEQIYCQGSKSSIGGNEVADETKDFENQVFNLSKGDIIYMFTDGYPDQFGGPMGKKFKMVRLRNLLKDICQLPMEEQYHHLKNTFNLWRDEYNQVDDVLFMGIKI
jgi:serine phosphatase RsbU (regulator of sigma subunit)